MDLHKLKDFEIDLALCFLPAGVAHFRLGKIENLVAFQKTCSEFFLDPGNKRFYYIYALLAVRHKEYSSAYEVLANRLSLIHI